MLRIASYNVNGIRATLKRGFEPWLSERGLDVLGLQEVRCRPADLPARCFGPYWTVYNPGQLAGRNGVAICTKTPVAEIRSWGDVIGFDPDGFPLDVTPASTDCPVEALGDYLNEGRYLEVDLADVPVTVGCLYLPKGATLDDDEAKYRRKQDFMAGLATYLDMCVAQAKTTGREFVIMGDFNIAHTNNDLKNWKSNQKSEGFLPEERAWFTQVLSTGELVDVLRTQYPDQPGPYSWWSWRGQAFVNDAGWRIDYQLSTPKLAEAATTAVIDRELDYPSRRSDHAALVIDYNI